MLVCAAGDCHGRLSQLYESVIRLEEQVGRQTDLVLQVGDLGVWPDPDRIDRATRHHDQAGDFADWAARQEPAPRPTIFIAGNHEDFGYLGSRETGTVLPGLTFLAWGDVTKFSAGGETLRIGGVGGCYGEHDYHMAGRSRFNRSHYVQRDLWRMVEQKAPQIDILMVHDVPAGRVLDMRGMDLDPRCLESRSEGLAQMIAAVKPRICLTGHVHMRTERRINGVRTVGLNIVPEPGSLLMMEFCHDEAEPVDVAEYGGRASGALSPDVDVKPADDPDALALELSGILRAWADQVRDGRSLTRKRLRRIRLQLQEEPCRDLLLAGLQDADLPALIERRLQPAERVEVMRRWSDSGMPTSTTE